MNQKPLPSSTYRRVDWSLIALLCGFLLGLTVYGLALYDRLVGILY